MTVENIIQDIEKRFKKVSKLDTINMEIFPLEKNSKGMQVRTDKNKSAEHGEVFTPLWLVDSMLERINNTSWKDQSLTTEDLCAGYGQFTIRILRKKYEVLKEKFDIKRFFQETHLFIECQPNSCFRLMFVFSVVSVCIRLLIGDASKKGLLPDHAERGIWVWDEECEKWYDRTVEITAMAKKHNIKGRDISENALAFEKDFLKTKKVVEQKI
jgi:hypothetical protein